MIPPAPPSGPAPPAPPPLCVAASGEAAAIAPPASATLPRTEAIDESAVAQHLSAAIQFRTISHQDPKDDDRSVFAAFRTFLETTYPKVHATLGHELVNGDALLYRWEGTDPSAP